MYIPLKQKNIAYPSCADQMKESQLHKADFADDGVLYTESLCMYPRNTTKQHRQEVRKPRLQWQI